MRALAYKQIAHLGLSIVCPLKEYVQICVLAPFNELIKPRKYAMNDHVYTYFTKILAINLL